MDLIAEFRVLFTRPVASVHFFEAVIVFCWLFNLILNCHHYFESIVHPEVVAISMVDEDTDFFGFCWDPLEHTPRVHPAY